MSFLKFLFQTDFLKTFYLNFYYFSVVDAIRFPILVAYRTRLETVRGGVKIECPISTGVLKFGYRGLAIVDSRYERSKWHVKGKLVINGKTKLGRGTSLVIAESGTCVLGKHFTITGRSSIICRDRIEFGSDVLISWDVLFMDTDYHHIIDNTGGLINKDKPIVVGNDVWVGCRSLILKGAIIPDGCVIAACSTISSRLSNKNTIYTSNSKIIRENVRWEV